MNLVQLANDLEYVPKDQLAEMSQDPNASYPSYLVLSEIQRRTQNEKAYAAAQPRPTSTVAEEVVNEFMQPKGLQAGMPPESAPTDVFSSGEMGMPASAPMQQPMQMAGGGLTAYANGGSLEQSFSDPMRQAMLAQLGFPSGMTDEELDAAIMERERIGNISGGFNDPKTSAKYLKESLMQFGFGDARPDSETPVFSRMTDEFTDYLNIIPGGGLGLLGLKTAFKGGKEGIKKGFKYLGDRARKKDPTLMGNPTTSQIKSSADIGKDIVVDTAKKIKGTLFGSVPRAAATTYGTGMALEGFSNLTSQEETVNKSDPFIRKNKDGTFTNTYFEELDKQKKLADIAAEEKRITDAANATEASRKEAIEKAKRKDKGYDLAQLGGLIMGSKSLGDLGMGIAGLAQQKQARDTSGKELDAKLRLIDAQILGIKDKTKYSQTDALRLLISTTEKQITELLDAGIYDQEKAIEELKKLEPQKARLKQLLQNMFGNMQVSNIGSDDQFMKSLSA